MNMSDRNHHSSLKYLSFSYYCIRPEFVKRREAYLGKFTDLLHSL